jgi:hypothetical protein
MPYIPPAMNLGDPLTAVPSIYGSEPREGRKSVSSVIAWSKPLAKSLTCVNLNLQNNATLEFSQIAGLIIDNSDCGCDLDFIFPDTNIIVSIPAYAPYTVLAVETRQTQFFVSANGAIVSDITRFSILNFTPDPVAVPVTYMQLTAGVGNITLDGAAVTQLVPNTVNGTLENLSISVAFPKPSVSFNDLLTIQDGTAKILWRGNVAADINSTGFSGQIGNLSDLSIRFTGGIQLVQTGGFAPGGTVSANLYYKTP